MGFSLGTSGCGSMADIKSNSAFLIGHAKPPGSCLEGREEASVLLWTPRETDLL